MHTSFVVALACALLFVASRAAASPVDDAVHAPVVAAPSDAEVSARLAFLDERFARGTAAADAWWYGWYATYGAATVGQATTALAVRDLGLRRDFAIGAATASLGVVGIGVPAFPACDASAILAAVPAATPRARRLKLARAERLLAASAKAEALGRSWFVHVAGAAISIATGLVLAVGYRHVPAGVAQLTGGLVVTEAQIFTQPTAAITDQRVYRARWPVAVF